MEIVFFFSHFFFHIWLNKIHLCKQTQDEALTKPNKQENKHGLPPSPQDGAGVPTPSQQPRCPQGRDRSVPVT